MRGYHIICVVLILLMVLCAFGCQKQSNNAPTTNQNKLQETTTYNDNLNMQVTICHLSREAFQSFLQDPSLEAAKNSSDSIFTFPDDGDYLNPVGAVILSAKDFSANYDADSAEITKFLSQNGITEKTEKWAIIDTPLVPLTLWLRISAENVFITIDPEAESYSDKFAFFTYDSFYSIYSCREGTLIVNGETVTAEKSICVYCDYADLPLISVLKALGAETVSESDDEIHMEYKNTEYVINVSEISFCKSDSESENLLTRIIGLNTFVYAESNEIMVDSTTLQTVLSHIGENITVETVVDEESQKATVYLTTEDQ